MNVETQSDITTIRFSSRHYRETVRILLLGLFVFPGLPLIWIGKNLEVPPQFWTYSFLIFFAYIAGLGYFATQEKRIEIHPERMYVKDWILEPEYEYPVTDRMVVVLENIPRVQWTIPREYWRISLGYPDGVYYLIQEMEDHHTIRRLAQFLANRFEAPLVDYTYADQTDLVMFFKPGETEVSFARRAVLYPDILDFGDLPAYKTINEDIINSGKRVYSWSAFSWNDFLRKAIIAAAAVLIIVLNIVSANPDALFSIPVGSNRVLYYILSLWILGSLVWSTGTRKTLTLTREKITYTSILYSLTFEKKEIPLESIMEIRVKPTPRGFTLIIAGKETSMDLQTHLGGIEDFGHLFWLSGRIQDFVLENRPAPPEPVPEKKVEYFEEEVVKEDQEDAKDEEEKLTSEKRFEENRVSSDEISGNSEGEPAEDL